ncbi:MazG-like family protein [Parafannyhessea umbonata]
MIYCVMLADRLGVDPVEAMRRKLEQNARKYPVGKAHGRSSKYTEL